MLRSCELIDWFQAELYDWCNTCYKSSRSLYESLLNLMASIASNLHSLTQFVIRQVCGQTSGRVRVRTEIGQ